jgi:hypothetical protein
MADTFEKRRFAAIDALRRDKRFAFSTRIVGLELFARTQGNPAHIWFGHAWPAQTYLAEVLGMNLKTVKRAIADLVKQGIFTIVRNGHFNRYRPHFLNADDGELSLGDTVVDARGRVVHSPKKSTRAKGTKTVPHEGQKRAARADKNGPESLESISNRFPSPPEPQPPVHNCAAAGQPKKESRNFGAKAGGADSDEKILPKVVHLFSRQGFDGWDALNTLDDIDPQLTLRLVQVYRNNGTIPPRDIAAANLLAWRGKKAGAR